MADKEEIQNKIKIQGEVVRKLKQEGADKDTVSCITTVYSTFRDSKANIHM